MLELLTGSPITKAEYIFRDTIILRQNIGISMNTNYTSLSADVIPVSWS